MKHIGQKTFQKNFLVVKQSYVQKIEFILKPLLILAGELWLSVEIGCL